MILRHTRSIRQLLLRESNASLPHMQVLKGPMVTNGGNMAWNISFQAPLQGQSRLDFQATGFPNIGSQFRRFPKDWKHVSRKFPDIGGMFWGFSRPWRRVWENAPKVGGLFRRKTRGWGAFLQTWENSPVPSPITPAGPVVACWQVAGFSKHWKAVWETGFQGLEAGFAKIPDIGNGVWRCGGRIFGRPILGLDFSDGLL